MIRGRTHHPGPGELHGTVAEARDGHVARGPRAAALLKELLDSYAARPGAAEIDVVLCEVGEQRRLLRDGRADMAIMHTPFDVMTGLDSAEIMTSPAATP
ncbi:substrate-binding domain-containing protein [Nonomuraea deserti]|uniref:substrate-binding domain-containing protein n=1 Tax=Nonomuraea deserti TaxID=1848322 RepID=UPI001C6FFC96|nr:substrate-binding domain-containing protein [Nonomuraea deserti]